MAEQFKNNASSTLAAVCFIGDTAIIVASAASFPTMGNFRLLVDNELMLCTAVVGAVFSVTRGIEGTAEANHVLGSAVILPLTAGSLATISGGGGGPTGPAGGVLDGTYPNPGLAASVAGDGLTETADVLSVNVDASSIEISADTLRVKALGITSAMLAGAIADAKLATSYIKADGTRAFSGDQSVGGHLLTNLSDPVGTQDAATKASVAAAVLAGKGIGAVSAFYDGGGLPLVTPNLFFLPYVSTGTIVGWTVELDNIGSISIDVYKCTYAAFNSVNLGVTPVNLISGVHPIVVTSAIKNTDTTLTGWTTAVTNGDIFIFVMTSCSIAARAAVQIQIQKS